MIDRIVHHADVLTLKGASYRLRGRGIDSLPSSRVQVGNPHLEGGRQYQNTAPTRASNGSVPRPARPAATHLAPSLDH